MVSDLLLNTCSFIIDVVINQLFKTSYGRPWGVIGCMGLGPGYNHKASLIVVPVSVGPPV